MTAPRNILVVGASLAGLRAVEALRRLGYAGRITCVGAERHLPYDRPPLSKEVLRGTREPEGTALRKPDSYDELEVDWRLGQRATALDLEARCVELDGGERLRFDGLLIATGARPRTLPDTPRLAGIHTLRSLDDCLAIRAALAHTPRVAVVGAGFIGAEVAASCRERGLEVTLIEALPVPLAAALGTRMGEVCAALHRDHGVDLRCGAGVSGFEGGDRVEAVRLADGKRVPADLVVVGVGVEPEVDWLRASGLALDDGVVCDATCAAGAPGVVAAGDVARWHNLLFDQAMRVEHWTHAVEQGEAAAARLLASDAEAQPFESVPFFWSDQYDRKIQLAGSAAPSDAVRIVHGEVEARRFVALYGRAGRLVGALGFNRARYLMQYRRAIRERASFDEAVAQAESG